MLNFSLKVTGESGSIGDCISIEYINLWFGQWKEFENWEAKKS